MDRPSDKPPLRKLSGSLSILRVLKEEVRQDNIFREALGFAGSLPFYLIRRVGFLFLLLPTGSVLSLVKFAANLKPKLLKILLGKEFIGRFGGARLRFPITQVSVVGLSFSVVLTTHLGSFEPPPKQVSAESVNLPSSYRNGGDDVFSYREVIYTEVPDGRPSEDPIEYIVQGGDTLSSIGLKFKVSADAIRFANSLVNPDYIKVGDNLIIPPVSGVLHRVKSGDTVASLAKKYKADEQTIIEFNYLMPPFELEVGSTIIVPDAEIPPLPKPKTSYYAYGNSNAVYNAPGGMFGWPVPGGTYSRGFSWYHPALDIRTKGSLLPVIASAAGTVTCVGYCGYGYGYSVVIDHGNGYETLYAHLSKITTSRGAHVGRGAQIGVTGATGIAYGIHLHFEVRYHGKRINPYSVL